MNMQDASNNRQCVSRCDPRTPWSDVLQSCVSDQNIASVICEIDTKGMIARTKFTKIDGTEVLSHALDIDQSPRDNVLTS